MPTCNEHEHNQRRRKKNLIIAVEVAKEPKTFNCKTCINKHCDDSNPSPFPIYEIPGVIDTNICLLPMVTNFSQAMLSLYNHYVNHLLPFLGGLLEQPHAYHQSMIIIDNHLQQDKK